MRGLKETTQSNIDILISPCDPDLRPPATYQASAEANLIDTNMDEAQKGQLEVEVSKVMQEPADISHFNREGGEWSELLLVGENRMYPTLRSKSLNTNPRKMRMKMKQSEVMPHLAGSVRDLVSVFSEGVVGIGQRMQSPELGPECSTADP